MTKCPDMTVVTPSHLQILQQIHDNLESPAPDRLPSPHQIDILLQFWVFQTCRHDESSIAKPSIMHTLGVGLCGLLSLTPDPFLVAEEATSQEDIFGEFKNLLLVHDKPINTMTWGELQDTIHAIQIEFRHILHLTNTEDGICSHVDLYQIMLMVMRRVGFWASHKASIQPNQSEAILSHFDMDKSGHIKLRRASVYEALDAIHSILSMYILLINSKFIGATDMLEFKVTTSSLHSHSNKNIMAMGGDHMDPMQLSKNTEEEIDCDGDLNDADGGLQSVEARCLQKIPLYNHHREASLDDFYEISMVSDLSPGAIIQYKNKFRYLFHSISQVVYYHHPSYARQIQQPLSTLSCYGAHPVNLLPLLRQIEPSIPILYEHTGAGLAVVTKKQPYFWLVVSGFVVLVDDRSQAYCAQDIRCLLAFALDSLSSKNHLL